MAFSLKPSQKKQFDSSKCIICQKDYSDIGLTRSLKGEGIQTLIQSATDRKDSELLNRLKQAKECEVVYHLSSCYKAYTHKKGRKAARKREESEESAGPSTVTQEKKRTRQSHSPLPTTDRERDPFKQKCIICNAVSKDKTNEKFRICEEQRAEHFVKARDFFREQDKYKHVTEATSCITDADGVFTKDLLCHAKCIRNFLREYDNEKGKPESTPIQKPNIRLELLDRLVSDVEPDMNRGMAFTLTGLKARADCEDVTFKTRDIKLHLQNYFGDKLEIVVPQAQNQSEMVYLNTVVSAKDMASKIRLMDPVKQCAELIRKELKAANFGLDDRFCDAQDLRDSWQSMQIPDILLKFLGILFKFNPKAFNERKLSEDITDENEEDEEEEDKATGVSDIKKRRMLALYQILSYDLNRGKKKTPLHVLNAEAIHNTCKSKTLITSFARCGLTISYHELMKYKNRMANYVVSICQGIVPLPSHFDKAKFTLGSMDNFDHEENTLSGIAGSHDTVSILIQDKAEEPVHRKPNISQSGIKVGQTAFNHNLKCQELREYVKPCVKPSLSKDYKVTNELFQMDAKDLQNIKEKDKAWSMARLDFSKLNKGKFETACEDQRFPSWPAFNSVVTEERLPERIVGFLPVIPYPVTEYQTVYSALKNFQDILSQLDQSVLPVACDEGVYHIVREIIMERPSEFKNIVPLLGSFHLQKVFIGVIGKYLQNSGAEQIWTENNIFGDNVVKSVMSGSHYSRSVKGMFLLSETMERLQLSEFFNEIGVSKYEKELKILMELKEAVCKKNHKKSRQKLKEFEQCNRTLLYDFENFRKKRMEHSETFAYWDGFIQLVQRLKNLIRADREGNFVLHLDTVQDILPLFALFDCINYLRWCSIYLEDMRRLQKESPDVYAEFTKGNFVVKRSPGLFKAIPIDQSLEQTINKSKKSTGGIIGTTKRKNYVAQWELIYHEMLAVSQLHREVTGVQTVSEDLSVHHEFTNAITEANEERIIQMINYIKLHSLSKQKGNSIIS